VSTVLEPSPAKPASRLLRWLAGILIGITITLVLIWVALSAFTGYGLLRFASLLRGGQVHINVDQPTVIRQIRALQRLETVSYTMDKIISGERENPVLPVVHGEVIAGVDLSKLQANDVVVNGRGVTIHLPQAEVFTTRLDSAKTRVYSRETGLFSTPDPNLESEVRQEAERQLQAAALEDGILKTASQNASQTLTTMLSGLGFETVRIQ